MKGCIDGEINLITLGINGAISLVCNVTQHLIPLLVDEGYLIVEEDGVAYFLCVDKE